MFQYGLVGNTIFFGGIALSIGYVIWEIRNINSYAAKLDEKEAREILGLANVNKMKQHKKKELAEQEIKSMAAKMHLQNEDVEHMKQKLVIKDDFDQGKQADI